MTLICAASVLVLVGSEVSTVFGHVLALGLEEDPVFRFSRSGLEDLEDEDRPDVHLDQAAGIVTDLALMREIGVVPPTTAQVQPEN